MRVELVIVLLTSDITVSETESFGESLTVWSLSSSFVSSFFFELRILLWIIIYTHNAERMPNAIQPPHISSAPTANAMRKPPIAVTNQPIITVITPVIRYTALSRPHARSASDEPIATIKQTYVVESGNLSDVAIAISSEAVVRFTVARIISYGAPLCSISAYSKRLSTKSLLFCGVMRLSR